MTNLTKIAVLDDYQGAALKSGDWSVLKSRAEITVFQDHLSEADAIVERLRPFDVLCIMRERTPLPRAILEQLPNLKLIVTTGTRNAALDVAAAVERGIVVCNTGYRSTGTVELTWALLLASARHIPNEWESVKKGGWQTEVGVDLRGKTLGILGLGQIGSQVAKIANAFGMNVIAWSQNLTSETAQQNDAKLVTKEELFREADILTIHLILSRRTRGIVGSSELRMMKPTAYLINTSRGPLIEESALIEVLKDRAIAGAALDVYDVEPLSETHPFRSLDNVLATPHIGFVTQDTYKVFYGDTIENIDAWFNGNPIRVISV